MSIQATNASSVFQFRRLSQFPLAHGVTSRDLALPGDGDINIAGRLSRSDAVANRRVWAAAIGIDADSLVTGRQVHGNRVRVVDQSDAGRGAEAIDTALPETDALITRTVDLPLMVYTADCVPLIVYDPVKHALGVAHAGWRGTVSVVAYELVQTMHREFGSDAGNLFAGIGPSIGPCCYEVGGEVIDAWANTGLDRDRTAVVCAGNRHHLDLWRANQLALQAAGILADQIEVSRICTSCSSDRYFSRRAANGHRGLFATIAALRKRPDDDVERGRRVLA